MKNFLTKKIFIASDHAGFELKQFLIKELSNLEIVAIDLGCESSTNSVDYPDYAQKLAKKIKSDSDFGILICGSGIGIAIAANRFNHIRCALCHNIKSAQLARAHNNANVISLGARFIKSKTAITMIKAFLTTKFEDGRHAKRVEKLS